MTKIIEDPQNVRGRRTHAALLRAARDLIEQDGFAALTMASVAERAGVSRRAVYLHFAGRTELLAALYRHLGFVESGRGREAWLRSGLHVEGRFSIIYIMRQMGSAIGEAPARRADPASLLGQIPGPV